jgi:hypothetical protein
MDYKLKYIKYKQKYLKLQKLLGGTIIIFFINKKDNIRTPIECELTDTLNDIIKKNEILNKPNIKFYDKKDKIIKVDLPLQEYNINNTDSIYFTFEEIDFACPNLNLIKYFDTFTHEENTLYIVILYSAIMDEINIEKNIEQQMPLKFIKRAIDEDKHIHIILVDFEFLKNSPRLLQINNILESRCLSQYISHDLLININNFEIRTPIISTLEQYIKYLSDNEISINDIPKRYNITKQFKITTIGYKLEDICGGNDDNIFFYFCIRYLTIFLRNKKTSSTFIIKSFNNIFEQEIEDIRSLIQIIPENLRLFMEKQDTIPVDSWKHYKVIDQSKLVDDSIVTFSRTSQMVTCDRHPIYLEYHIQSQIDQRGIHTGASRTHSVPLTESLDSTLGAFKFPDRTHIGSLVEQQIAYTSAPETHTGASKK